VNAVVDTILVVDDDEGNRYFKSHVLRGGGFRVVEAGRGAEGLAKVDAEQPSVVVLDIRLPDMNGLDVCREIKARHPSTIVLQTSAAFVRKEDRAVGLDGGADAYLVEPLDDAELVATVRALLRLHQAERDLRSINETLERRVAERTRELADANQLLSEEAGKRAAAEEALRHAEKLDAIGQLTGGVAHDFNNLLTVVIGNLDVAEQSVGRTPLPVERLLRSIDTARRAAFDCERLTQQLLAFARRDPLRAQVVDLNDVITRFVPLLKHALGEQVTLDLQLAAELWRCRVDPKQFETALLNLAANARDAMPLGGPILIATENVEILPGSRQAGKSQSWPQRDGAYVRLRVGDSGTGMSKEVLAHVFEPFFTTKDVGQGSGLGLSQVYGFVTQSGGEIAIDTAPGRGTRIDIFLHRVQEAAATLPRPVTLGEPPGGSETILIVEDNELVLELATTILRELGYRVMQAKDGKSALDAINHEPAIDLLFTDVVMPNRMSGVELARAARSCRPDLKVLMTSGYAAQRSGNLVPDEFPSITKPYHRLELANRIRQLLDAP
jgi:signal transduction histidine kinase